MKEQLIGRTPELNKQNLARITGGAALFGSSLIPGNINAQESEVPFEKNSDSSHVLDIEGQVENNPPELEGFVLQNGEEQEIGPENPMDANKSFIPGYANENHRAILDRLKSGDYKFSEQEVRAAGNLEEHKSDLIESLTPTPTPTPTSTPVPPTPTPVPSTPTPQPAPVEDAPSGGAVDSGEYPRIDVNDGIWNSLAQCESSGNWHINTGNGFYGGVQFTRSTWLAFGGGEFAPLAHQATREQQIIIAERTLAGQGWGAWPACSEELGLR